MRFLTNLAKVMSLLLRLYFMKTEAYVMVTGYYLQMPSGSGLGNRRPLASLVSLEIPPKITCLTFYYHLSGKNIDSLRVVLRLSQKDVLVWQMDGNHTNDAGNYSSGWNKAQIPLNKTGSATYKVCKIRSLLYCFYWLSQSWKTANDHKVHILSVNVIFGRERKALSSPIQILNSIPFVFGFGKGNIIALSKKIVIRGLIADFHLRWSRN